MLNTIEERQEIQSHLFRGVYNRKGNKQENNLYQVRVPIIMVCVAVITVNNNLKTDIVVRCYVLTATSLKKRAFWDITPWLHKEDVHHPDDGGSMHI
jgi:hypothetical protein